MRSYHGVDTRMSETSEEKLESLQAQVDALQVKVDALQVKVDRLYRGPSYSSNTKKEMPRYDKA